MEVLLLGPGLDRMGRERLSVQEPTTDGRGELGWLWGKEGLEPKDIETIPTYHMSPRPVYRQFHKRENPEAIPFRTNAQN